MPDTMSNEIRTVAVVGCGVIGMGWAALFLSRGFKVIISDPAEGAEEGLQRYLELAKPFLEEHGDFKQLVANYEFVRDIAPRLAEADFVQEVSLSGLLDQYRPADSDLSHRTDPSAWNSSGVSSRRSISTRDLVLSSRRLLRVCRPRPSSSSARKTRAACSSATPSTPLI